MRCPECGNDNREGARFCDSCGARLDAVATGDGAGAEPAAEPAPSAARAEYAPLPDDAPTEVGGGRFELAGFLGEGTRKRVYLARDRERDGTLVAVATFSTEGMAATAQARARREAEAMATLGEHPHTVPVLASGQDGPRPYIASQYMPGGDLGDLLNGADDRRLGVERSVRIASDVATALEHAHSSGIIHRDIKPANIWLDSAGNARLGDFGLAAEARAQVAVERTLVGTAIYLPPEQAIGRRTDERADLYSLGALLYEMLVGEPPFPGTDPVSIISRHLSAEPVAPSRHNPEVPAALDRLVGRLLAKAPDERPASAAEVRGELGAIDLAPGAEEDDEPEKNPLDALAGGLFVGRESEFAQLREQLESVIDGRGGAALIEGEPGIGKTRMLEELITYARIRGATVLTSSCHEADAAPAYWPFAQAVRAFVRDADPVGLAWQLGSDGPELARIVPELRERVPSIPAPEPLGGEESRFRFFEAVAGFLTGAARSKPLVLALDDMHWADSSSLELIRFLAHRLLDAPLLLIGAYRPDEAGQRDEVERAIAELDEVTNRVRLVLPGLSRDAIASYLELTTGTAGSPELVAEIHEQTGGNPFFIGEVVRLIATEHRDGQLASAAGREVPRGVREAVSRRIARLSDEVTETLEVAAVAGREFEEDLLERVLDRPVGADLDAALGARILERHRDETSPYLFAHAVFREALYEGLGAARRLELHERVALALEELCGSEREPHLQALARHFVNAGPRHAETALDYALAAARQATEQLAHADAADYLERALDLLGADEPQRRIELRLELADEMARCGRFNDARRELWETVALAREQDDVDSLAAAVLSISTLTETGSVDTDLLTLLDEVLERVDEDRMALRARLLAALSTELYWGGMEGRCQEVGQQAVELARGCDDDSTLAEVLSIRQFLEVARPETAALRLDNATEMLAAARRAGDRRNEVRALAYSVTSHLQVADVAAADRALGEYEALARRLAEPRHIWHVPIIQATRAMMDGRFDHARELSEEGRRLGALAEEPLAEQFHAAQMLVLHTYEGRPEEMLPLIRRMVEAYPGIPAWRLALINFLTEADRLEEARAEYEPIAARGFGQFPRDANWVVGLSRLGEAASRLDDADACRELLTELEAFAGEILIIGRGAVSNGPIDRALGMMAAVAGDLDRAIRHLDQALEICERTGERPQRADARLQLGRVLLERNRQGDRDRAFEVLSLALEEGHELGMRKLVERAVRLRLEAQGVAGVDAAASIDSVALAVSDERPDLLSFASPDGRVTILFSDIENSTLMTERLGDDRWIEVLREHNALFRRNLGEFGGYEVKNQGDGFMLAFPDPVAALECALAVQRDLDLQAASEEQRIRVRIGMHVGEVIEEEGDFFGRSVILAARIAAQARGGEVLVSEALHEIGERSFGFDAGRELELKGLAGTHRVYRVEPQPAGAAA